MPDMKRSSLKDKDYIIIPIVAIIGTILVMPFSRAFDAQYIAIIVTFAYMAMFYSWKKINSRIELYLVFMICTYLFYYGRYFLLFINYKKYISKLNEYGSVAFINQVALFTLLCIEVMHVTYIVFSCRKTKRQIIFQNWKCNSSAVSIVAWVMFCVSFCFSMKVLLMNISITRMYGYAYALRMYYSGYRVERFFSNFLPGAFILLILRYKNNKLISCVVYGFLMLYLAMYFLSGSRLQAVLLIFALILVFEYEFKHFNRKRLISLSGMLIALCFLLIIISSIRNGIQNSASIAGALKEWKNGTDDNFIINLLSECGFQIYSIAVVIKNCPFNVPYNYGLTYLKGIGQLMPNLFWSQNPFMQESIDTIFAYYLNGGMYGIGSSYIAEGYYNFGYFSILFMPLVGFLFAKYRNMVITCYSAHLKNIMSRYFLMSIPTEVLY
ncbi:O-antigen polysaccharide polymerase Wzy [Jutongia sp.]